MKPKTNSLWFKKKFRKSLNFSIFNEQMKMRREKSKNLKIREIDFRLTFK